MIKLIIFDFDGVIADCKEIHYNALNKALENIDSKFVITKEEHISIFDGLSTKKKLTILSDLKSFPLDKFDQVYNDKQLFTMQMMDCLKKDERLMDILSKLKNKGYLVYMGSNAIRQTVEKGLFNLGILDFFDKIYSNEDVKNQKPNPEVYLKCMVDAGVKPKETIIIEDSKNGREAAVESGAFVCGVDNPLDVSFEKISLFIDNASKKSKIKWAGKDITILIPMAGAGSRFKNKGYKLPKPLIDVCGKPMIQRVVENINIDGNYVFVVQESHYDEYNLGIILPLISPGCKIITIDGLTKGAACTSLLAKELINNDNHLLIVNPDQLIEWDSCDFIYNMLYNEVDGGILTFIDNTCNPKWSFAKIDDKNLVVQVAEKNPISNIATVGVYYFNKGSQYVYFTEQMINNKIMTNGEYYICPIYNEYIKSGKKIKIKNCDKMWGVGTPEDLDIFIENYDNLNGKI